MNVAGLNHDDVHRIQQLLDLAVQNQWYALAETLKRSRDELRKQLSKEWAEGELQRIADFMENTGQIE